MIYLNNSFPIELAILPPEAACGLTSSALDHNEWRPIGLRGRVTPNIHTEHAYAVLLKGIGIIT